MGIFFRKKERPLRPERVGEFNRPFDLEMVKAEVSANAYFIGSDEIAKGVDKVAELIAGNFPGEEIRFMVDAKSLSPEAPADAFPVHFMFYKEGKPKAAVVVVSDYGTRIPSVVKTKLLCERLGINYLRIFANGSYGDWITGERNGEKTPESVVEFCKNRNVERIREALM